MIYGALQIVGLVIDLHVHLIEVPAPTARPHGLDPAPSDLTGKHRAKPVPPETNRLVCDVDAALVKQVLDVPQRKRKPDIHHHRKANDFRRRLELAKRADLADNPTLQTRPFLLNRFP